MVMPMATSAYLDDDYEERAKKLISKGDFDSISEVVKRGLALLEKQMREQRLAEKYSRESAVSDAELDAQQETLSDLDG